MARGAAPVCTFDPLERLAQLQAQAKTAGDGEGAARLRDLHLRAGEARQHQQSEPGVGVCPERGPETLFNLEPDAAAGEGGAAPLGLLDTKGHARRAAVRLGRAPVVEIASPSAELGRPGGGPARGTGTPPVTPFVQRCREAEQGRRPRFWWLINQLEGNGRACEGWGEQLAPGDEGLIWRRWENLSTLYAALQGAAGTDEIGRTFGQRGDQFAEWLGCAPRDLLDLLEGDGWYGLSRHAQ